MTKIIGDSLLDELTRRAQNSPRLRMNRRQAERRYKLVCSLPRREGGKAKFNYNFHQSLEEKCHRILTPSTSVTTRQSTSKLALRSLFRRLNAVELGTDIPIHRHPDKDESFVILKGKVRSTTYNELRNARRAEIRINGITELSSEAADLRTYGFTENRNNGL